MDISDMRGAEIVRRGEELYEARIRREVEDETNLGKIVSIDIETGDYEVDSDLIQAGLRMKARRPDAVLYGRRIGYDAVFAVGGTISRTNA